jgi:hypothetical protein
MASGPNPSNNKSSEDLQFLETRIKSLSSQISDEGHVLDRYKTGTALLMGAGVFLLLLAAGSAYDLVSGKTAVWLSLGISKDILLFASALLGLVGLFAVVKGALRQRKRDVGREAQLARLEQELADLKAEVREASKE